MAWEQPQLWKEGDVVTAASLNDAFAGAGRVVINSETWHEVHRLIAQGLQNEEIGGAGWSHLLKILETLNK